MKCLISIIAVLLGLNAVGFLDPTSRQAEDFWRLYQDCIEYNVAGGMLASSDINIHFSSEHYRRLQGFGVEILELLYKASISNRLDAVIANKYKVPVNFVEMEKRIVIGRLWSINTLEYTTKFTDVDVVWPKEEIESKWNGGDRVANARAEFLLKEMRSAQGEHRDWDARRAMGNLQLMGVFAFPVLFNELSQGNDDVIEIFVAEEWRAANKPLLTKDGLMEWWKENKMRYELPKQAAGYSGALGLDKWKRTGR